MDGLTTEAPTFNPVLLANTAIETDVVLPAIGEIVATTENVSVFYRTEQALRDVSFDIKKNDITAIIGPSGCGKSTLLRCFNRMNDLIDGFRMTGTMKIHGEDIYDKKVDPVELRKVVGMVFQDPNPFPMSIFDNVAYGPRIHGIKNKSEVAQIVETSLTKAGLWDEVKDILSRSGKELSGGQQQRLCIARTLAVAPSIILMDEPTSKLDPIACAKLEETIRSLKEDNTILINTHNMEQAKRISDRTAFFYLGRLVEYGDTEQIFESPINEDTKNYVNGKFG